MNLLKLLAHFILMILRVERDVFISTIPQLHNGTIPLEVEAESQYCDLDDYLQQELEKLQQEAGEECEQSKDSLDQATPGGRLRGF